ncbi:TPR repeat, SEL1 subfamily [Candidatus Phaeomarinobacter ectocarpi]|uniref:TPR repeat, SEL1 subfamily n=1 Tax=Candidatus Phaeomarinibacter ectocarpi TaxID=1458461 RepID=X5M9G0_9HYPH|nr:TPR repeat, SEL1 subfamily [Candidatus Phaeomarinobacter ectocarpi]
MKGIEPEAREAAKIAARREGKTLGQWLNEKIIDASDEEEADISADTALRPPASSSGNPMPQQALQIDFSPVTDALRDLVHRLERSERRSENALTGLDETLADMSTRLERTERMSREPGLLSGGSGSGLDSTLADLRERLEKSERGLERAEHLNTDAMRTVERGLRAISNRLEETERRADEASKQVQTVGMETPETVRHLQSALTDLSRRLDTTESAATTAREQAAQAVAAINTRGGASDDAVAALERAIGNVVDHIEASDARTAKALGGLRDDLEKLEKAASETKPGVGVEAIQTLEGTISALQQNVTEMVGRLGQVENNTQRDVDQIAGAIDNMGSRLDTVREAAVSAATDAARQEGSVTAQLVSQLEQRVDEVGQQHVATQQRIEQSEQQSAQAIHTIETSVTDIAGQMREIANIGAGGKEVFAEPLAALETAIEEMADRLQTTDQRSAKALAKVEEVSDELLRKLDGANPTDDIQQIKSSVENVDARLNLIEAANKGTAFDTGPELGFMAGAPAADQNSAAAMPPPPPATDWTATADEGPFGPPPEAGQMGAPPFMPSPDMADGQSSPFGEPPFPDHAQDTAAPLEPAARNDFLESARQAARAAAGSAGPDTARSPFADDEQTQRAGMMSGSRKPLALIAAGLAVVAVAGLIVVMMGGGPKEVAGPPDDVTAPLDVMAELDAPTVDVTPLDVTPDAEAEAETPATDTAPSEIADAGETTRPPARELPDVVSPAEASAPADVPSSAEQAVAGQSINGPTSITPRQEVDVASLPTSPAEPQRQTLREAATNGDASAQYEIGQRYANGSSGVPQDNEQAAYWLNRAAEQGLAPAQYRLGTMFEKGLGLPENPTKARTWYERAAAQGNVKAMHNLAVMQAEGAGGPQDFAGASRSFEAAAQHGLADSQYNLAILHERGLGVERDLAEAYKWFTIASANGDADAGARAEALKNSVDAAKLVDAELAARTFTPRSADAAANQVSWQAEMTPAAMVREAQRILGSLGYDAGPADGRPGNKTLDAVRKFERDKGLAVTGRIDGRLMDALQKAAI